MNNDGQKKRKLCSLVDDPCDECFVSNMNSQTIKWVIYYCGGHFEECEIYKSRRRACECASSDAQGESDGAHSGMTEGFAFQGAGYFFGPMMIGRGK